MPAGPLPPRKPLKWVGSSRKNLAALPEDVQDVFGSALLDVQYGDTPDGARPFGEGLPHEIWKVVEDFASFSWNLSQSRLTAGILGQRTPMARPSTTRDSWQKSRPSPKKNVLRST